MEDVRLVFDVGDRISIQNGLDKLEKDSEVNKFKLIRLCIWKKKPSKVHIQNVSGNWLCYHPAENDRQFTRNYD